MAYDKQPKCRHCDLPIQFALTEKGKRMPINPPKPEDVTNLAATYAMYDDKVTGADRVRYIGEAQHFDPDTEHPVVPHFATCPGHKLGPILASRAAAAAGDADGEAA